MILQNESLIRENQSHGDPIHPPVIAWVPTQPEVIGWGLKGCSVGRFIHYPLMIRLYRGCREGDSACILGRVELKIPAAAIKNRDNSSKKSQMKSLYNIEVN